METEIFVWVSMVPEAAGALQDACTKSFVDILGSGASVKNSLDVVPSEFLCITVTGDLLRRPRCIHMSYSVRKTLIPDRLAYTAVNTQLRLCVLYYKILSTIVLNVGDPIW